MIIKTTTIIIMTIIVIFKKAFQLMMS